MDSPVEHSSTAREPDARVARTGRAAADEPRIVIRGETHPDADQSGATALVDWLAFTVRPPVRQDLTWLKNALLMTFCVPPENWNSRGRGWAAYKHCIDLGERRAFGLLAYGGESQRGTLHVELNAHACARIVDWDAVRAWGEVCGAAITRSDLAHDDFAGDVLTIAAALQWLRDGAFSVYGRPPRARLEDDLGSNAGKTLYVGRRGSGKLLRVYERGKKEGDPESRWVRAEVELRNKGRVVPWEVVTDPGCYLAGAYPALRVLCARQSRIRTIQRAGEINYDRMVQNLRVQGGKSLNVMLVVNQGDPSAVLSQVVREGIPSRLVGLSDAVLAALHGEACEDP